MEKELADKKEVIEGFLKEYGFSKLEKIQVRGTPVNKILLNSLIERLKDEDRIDEKKIKTAVKQVILEFLNYLKQSRKFQTYLELNLIPYENLKSIVENRLISKNKNYRPEIKGVLTILFLSSLLADKGAVKQIRESAPSLLATAGRIPKFRKPKEVLEVFDEALRRTESIKSS